MSGSQAASNSGSALALASKPVQIIKLVKPAAGQTENFYASFDGPVKVDFTAIAHEQVTYYHDSKNHSLRVVFTDGSQVIIEPFFDPLGVMPNLVFEMAPGQVLDSAQFVSQFPITTGQSVQPALTEGPAQSGAEFNDPSIDSLPANSKLALLPPEQLPPFAPPEELHNLAFTNPAGFLPPEELPENPANSSLTIVKEALPGQVADVAGETLNYTITVTNTGNTTLTGIVVTDPNADPGSVALVVDAASADGKLDVGETWTYTATHTVTQAELDSGADLVNTATATGDGVTTPASDDATVTVAQASRCTSRRTPMWRRWIRPARPSPTPIR